MKSSIRQAQEKRSALEFGKLGSSARSFSGHALLSRASAPSALRSRRRSSDVGATQSCRNVLIFVVRSFMFLSAPPGGPAICGGKQPLLLIIMDTGETATPWVTISSVRMTVRQLRIATLLLRSSHDFTLDDETNGELEFTSWVIVL
jgi:hypothetical protein